MVKSVKGLRAHSAAPVGISWARQADPEFKWMSHTGQVLGLLSLPALMVITIAPAWAIVRMR